MTLRDGEFANTGIFGDRVPDRLGKFDALRTDRQQSPVRKRRVSQASIQRHRPNGAPLPDRFVPRA